MKKVMAHCQTSRIAKVNLAIILFIFCGFCPMTYAQQAPALAKKATDTLPKPPIKAADVNATSDKTTTTGPLSKTPENVPVVPEVKASAPIIAPEAPAVVEKPVPEGPLSKMPKNEVTRKAVALPTAPMTRVNVSPMNANNSGKMGNCIEFYTNKAVISDSSRACLKEISKFLITNKNLKINVAASVLPTEKSKDIVALTTERAKTIRNFLIQSGVEPSRLAIKTSEQAAEAPIVMTPQ
jgi:outer membrane protein OmpA-like peptidoglycan-associated protein